MSKFRAIAYKALKEATVDPGNTMAMMLYQLSQDGEISISDPKTREEFFDYVAEQANLDDDGNVINDDLWFDIDDLRCEDDLIYIA